MIRFYSFLQTSDEIADVERQCGNDAGESDHGLRESRDWQLNTPAKFDYLSRFFSDSKNRGKRRQGREVKRFFQFTHHRVTLHQFRSHLKPEAMQREAASIRLFDFSFT